MAKPSPLSLKGNGGRYFRTATNGQIEYGTFRRAWWGGYSFDHIGFAHTREEASRMLDAADLESMARARSLTSRRHKRAR